MTIIDVIHEQVFRNLLKYLSRQAIIIFSILVLVYVVAQQREAIAALQQRNTEIGAVLAAVKTEQDRRTTIVRAFEKDMERSAALERR